MYEDLQNKARLKIVNFTVFLTVFTEQNWNNKIRVCLRFRCCQGDSKKDIETSENSNFIISIDVFLANR